MKKIIIILVAVLVVIGAGVGIYAMTKKDTTDHDHTTHDHASTETTTTEETAATEEAPAVTTEAAIITYSDEGYSPSTITVKTGTTVTIKNTTSRAMQFDSDPHPAHTTNKELNADSVAPGKSETFTVTKTGTFGYHNHLNASETGTIIVQ